MEKEVSLYHQLVEHPIILFLVGSLLLMALLAAFGNWAYRHSKDREERSAKSKDSNGKTNQGA
ncbi:MAG TPA: hypothetical protein PKD26_10475 [Pyrinomonadaceae bacterium]|nr:hypothetical protein [Pyrinomonadaceae bacterium]